MTPQSDAPEDKDLRVLLEGTESAQDEATRTWQIILIATALGVRDRPRQNVEIQFYHNGEAADSPIATEGDGRATKSFSGLTAGVHTFEAVIAGISKKSKLTRTFKEPKGAAKIRSRRTKIRRGEWKLIFTVFTEENVPVKDAVIELIDAKALPEVNDLKPTDKNGDTSCIVIFGKDQKERFFTARVLGTTIETWGNLFP